MDLNIKLIQESFELVKPRAEEFASRFYANFFRDYPAAEPLFGPFSLDKQKRLLVAGMVQVIHNLENPEFLGEYLGRMGESHYDHGLKEEHFEWLGLTLLRTLKEMCGSDWTREINHQWALALNVVAALMREGLERMASKVVPLRKAEPEEESMAPFHLTLPRDVIEQLDQLAKTCVQQAVREYFEQATQKELKKIMGHSMQDFLKKVS